MKRIGIRKNTVYKSIIKKKKKKTVVTLDWLNAVRERVANGTEEFRGGQVTWSVVTITA